MDQERYVLAVSETVVNQLQLDDEQTWPDIKLLAELQGGHGALRFRFDWSRASLISAADLAERFAHEVRQTETHRYASGVSRALRHFVKTARALVGVQ